MKKDRENPLLYHHIHVLLCRSRRLNCTFLKLAGWIADAKLVRIRGEWAMSVSKSTCLEKKKSSSLLTIKDLFNKKYFTSEYMKDHIYILFTTSFFTMINCTPLTSATIKFTVLLILLGKRNLKKKTDKCRVSRKCSVEQLRNRTLRFGVKGSGSLMFRGKALSIRFRIWMQLGGMTSQKLKW